MPGSDLKFYLKKRKTYNYSHSIFDSMIPIDITNEPIIIADGIGKDPKLPDKLVTLKIIQSDMTDDKSRLVSEIISSAFKEHFSTSLKAVASTIKKECDSQFDKYWHCIIGRAFASNVSHGKHTRSSCHVNVLMF